MTGADLQHADIRAVIDRQTHPDFADGQHAHDRHDAEFELLVVGCLPGGVMHVDSALRDVHVVGVRRG